MYSAGQKKTPREITIALDGLTSADGAWRVDCRVVLAMASLAEWSNLAISDTLDYGALAGHIRFILDTAMAPEAALAAYAQQLPRLFSPLAIADHSLTITNAKPSKSCKVTPEDCAVYLDTARTLGQKELTAVVLICSGSSRAGTWLLTPYSSLADLEPDALCLAVTYSGYLPTERMKANYFDYPPKDTQAQTQAQT